MFYVVKNQQNKKALESLENIEINTRQGIRKAFYFIGKELTQDSKKSILDKPKTGRVYLIRRGSSIRQHQASAPGEAPANLSGTLRKSINFLVRGSEQLTFGAGAEYAKYLERGTTKMAARPYLSRSIENNQRNTQTTFEMDIKAELQK